MYAHEKCECESMRMRNGVAQIEWLQTLWMCCGCKSFARFGNNQKLVIKLRVFGRWFCVWCDGMFELPAVIFFSAAEGKCPLVGIAQHIHRCCRTRYDNVDDDEDLSRPFNRPQINEISLLHASEQAGFCVSVSVWSQARKTINKVLMRFWDRIIDV